MSHEFKPGDRVLIVGEVSAIYPHHNGVTAITVRWGEGVVREVVVPDSIVQPVDLLESASAYDLIPYDPCRQGIRSMQIVRRSTDPDAWAIYSEGSCLARDGEWEWESLPSSRTEDFLLRCRWPTAREAMDFAKDHLDLYPTGYKGDS